LSSFGRCVIISNMKTTYLLICSTLFLLAGCWTISETEYPTVAVKEGNGVRVKLSNFRTGLTRYRAVEGHESMSGTEADDVQLAQDPEAHTETSGALKVAPSNRLVVRTVAELKRKGFVMDTKKPQYVIELAYKGPVWPENDVWHQAWFGFCTLFTAEDVSVTWSAQLKVRDGATNKLLYKKDFDQTYDVTAWGPIPVGSPAFCGKASSVGANSWALTALTDQAVADAAAFIAGRGK